MVTSSWPWSDVQAVRLAKRAEAHKAARKNGFFI